MLNPYEPLSARTSRGLAVFGVVSVLLVWSLLSGFHVVGPNKLPAPWEVLQAFADLTHLPGHEGNPLVDAVLASMSRMLVAVALTVLIGLPTGVLMGAEPRVNAALSPLIDPCRSAPIVSVLPVLVMWLGMGELMKISFLWLGGVVYLIPMVRDAIVAVPQVYYIKAKDLGATPVEAILKAVFPMARPRVADAVIVSTSIQWTYITVAEYVNADSGIGKLISDSKRFSAMDQVFAEIATIIFLALLTYNGGMWLKKRLFPWETS